MKANADFVHLVEKVFFLAMMRGYVSPQSKKSLAELPGSKLISFETGLSGQHFLVQDLYFVSPGSPISSGITTISCNGIAVWYMTYGGQYEKKVIPFLKKALSRAYSDELFRGGRGPQWYPYSEASHDMRYENIISKNHFFDFQGRERIIDPAGGEYGWHDYFGGMMIPLE